MKTMSCIFTIVFYFLCFSITAAEEMTVSELLNKFEEAQKPFRRSIIKSDDLYEYRDTRDEGKTTWGRNISEYRRDSELIDLIASFYELAQKDAPLNIEDASIRRLIWDGEKFYQYDPHKETPGTLFISQDQEDTKAAITSNKVSRLEGFFKGDREESVFSIIRGANNVKVRQDMDVIDGTSCYVLDAETPNGKYYIWIAPKYGYNMVKAHVYKSEGDILYGEQIGAPSEVPSNSDPIAILERVGGNLPIRRHSEFVFTIDNIRFENIDNVWVPVEADIQFITKYDNGDIQNTKVHHKRTHVDINPDFKAIKAFIPDIEEGSRVYNGLSLSHAKTLAAIDILNEHKKAVENSLLISGKSTFKAEVRRKHKVPDGYNPGYDSINETFFVLHDSDRIDMRYEQKDFDHGIIVDEYERQYLVDKGISHLIFRKPDVPVPDFIYATKKDSFNLMFETIAVNGYLEGYSAHDDKYFWEIFEEAEDLKLRENMEIVNGHETYVLETKIPSQGQYTLWIDPAFGYKIRKLVIKMTSDDLSDVELREGGIPSAGPQMSFLPTERIYTLNSVDIEKIGDVFVPVSGVLNNVNTFSNGEQMVEEFNYKRYEIDLNPDFSKYPDAFILDTPDGTPVLYADYMETEKRFEWRDDKVIEKVDQPKTEETDNAK
ncbi:MAG: hypothetical protein JXA96_06455 [Sedimentisphaerales bacterium]|nr:hypothetical protein [Sedimentisphaerales bacterium]